MEWSSKERGPSRTSRERVGSVHETRTVPEHLSEKTDSGIISGAEKVSRRETIRLAALPFGDPGTTQLHSRQDKFSVRLARFAAALVPEALYRYWIDGVLLSKLTAWATVAFGALNGWVIAMALMAPITLAIFYAWIKTYDSIKKDLYFLETIKEKRDEKYRGRPIARVVHNTLAFLGFSSIVGGGDPVLATLYARKGVEEYNGMNVKDHLRLIASTAISNAIYSASWIALLVNLPVEEAVAVGKIGIGAIIAYEAAKEGWRVFKRNR